MGEKMKQLHICVAGTLLLTAAYDVQAQDKTKVYKNAQDCSAIESNSTRLACYDSVAKGTDFTVEVRKRVERKNFGKSSLEREKPKKEVANPRGEAQQVTVQIVKVIKKRTGKHTFVTSEGQVWRQLSAGYVPYEKVPYKATLKQGLLGSYSLVSQSNPKVIKVKRTK